MPSVFFFTFCCRLFQQYCASMSHGLSFHTKSTKAAGWNERHWIKLICSALSVHSGGYKVTGRQTNPQNTFAISSPEKRGSILCRTSFSLTLNAFCRWFAMPNCLQTSLQKPLKLRLHGMKSAAPDYRIKKYKVIMKCQSDQQSSASKSLHLAG